jgi:nucleoid-associated protein YgaU
VRPRRALALLCAASLAAPAATAAEDVEDRVHEVRAGETLWTIAGDAIGDPTLWPALYFANRDQIKHPAQLYPGQKLRIPRIDPATKDAVRKEAVSLGQK